MYSGTILSDHLNQVLSMTFSYILLSFRLFCKTFSAIQSFSFVEEQQVSFPNFYDPGSIIAYTQNNQMVSFDTLTHDVVHVHGI